MTQQLLNYSSLKKINLAKNTGALLNSDKYLAKLLEHNEINYKIQLFKDDKFINGNYLINRYYEKIHHTNPLLTAHQYYQEYEKTMLPVLLLGIGLGYGLIYLLNKTAIPKIYLYERDKSLLKIALTIHDFSDFITNGRLEIITHERIDLLAERDIATIIPDPVFFSENKVEFQTLSRIIKTRRFAGHRAVILSGALFIFDLASTLFDMEWDVFEIDETTHSENELFHTLQMLNPDLIIKINLLKDIEKFSKTWNVVQWEIDPTLSPLSEIATDQTNKFFVYSHNPQRVAQFKSLGYKSIQYLPLCSNPRKFYPRKLDSESEAKYACDVSFVGSLLLNNQKLLMDGLIKNLHYLASHSTPDWQHVINWINELSRQPVLIVSRKLWIDDFNNLLLKYNLPNQLQLSDNQLLISACIDEYLGYLWRKEVIAAFLPMNINLWGDPDWLDDFPGHYKGIADHYTELPKIYIASKINLDISRSYQDNIITMRVFDVAACGGFVLAARNDSLLELFEEDTEIVCYESPDEAVEKALYYLKNEEQRQKISARCHQKVLKNNTFRHRLSKILADVDFEQSRSD